MQLAAHASVDTTHCKESMKSRKNKKGLAEYLGI